MVVVVVVVIVMVMMMMVVVVVVVVVRVPFTLTALHSQPCGAPESCTRMSPDLNFPPPHCPTYSQ